MYSHVPNKRIDTLIFSKQIRLLGPVLTPIRVDFDVKTALIGVKTELSVSAWKKLLKISVSIRLLETREYGISFLRFNQIIHTQMVYDVMRYE